MTAPLADHTIRAHALLSASAAKRWLNCTPSAWLTKDMPDQVSEFAAEGTLAHETAEAALTAWLKGKEATFEDQHIYSEVKPYVDKIIEDFTALEATSASAVLFLEQRVDFSKWVKDGFGTADCVMLCDNVLYVRDLKFGKGVKVDAPGNDQIRLYALGAYEKFSDLYDIDTVVGQIHQPRLSHFSEEVITIDNLLAWANDYVAPRAELASRGAGQYVAGDWCRFCKAATTCRTRAKHYLDLDELVQANPDVDLLTPEEIGAILEKAEGISTWCSSLKDFALKSCLDGEEIPGWKAVEGRSVRRFSDENEVVKTLSENGYTADQIYKKTLLSVSEAEKLCGKKHLSEMLKDCIIKPSGKPTLVKDSDKREAYSSASADFGGIEHE